MEKLIVLLCTLHVCYGVIYKLNVTEYDRMPSKYAGDSFERCHWDPDPVYCFGEYVLVSDTPSPLLDMIHEYSAHNTTHFNHTKIRRGLCVTQSCTKFNMPGLDIKTVLEACLNESIYSQYQLKTRLTDKYFCNQPPKNMQPDTLDVVVAVICGIIVLANFIGTIYEPFCGDRQDGVSKFLLCFAIRQNWRKLTASPAESQDPRMKRLKSIHGVRAISIALVIMAHSILACVAYIDNPEYVEQMYNFESLKIVFSGMIIMQTFLVMSGFLLVYISLVQAEKRQVTWMMLPKLLIFRWLRLTPPYAVVLALTVTWLRFLTAGPLWQEMIGKEVSDCRENWWLNLLYVNNYNDQSQCMQHTWYIAADTQLYCLGVLVYLVCSTPRSRKICLPIIFVLGSIIPGIHTYYQNLDGSLIASPEAIHNIFMDEPTFNNTYRRGHTNIAGYTLGLAIGYLIYHCQKTGVDINRFRRYRYGVPFLVPLSLGIIYLCSLFFGDIPRPSLNIRVVSSCLLKPVFGFIIALAIFVFVLKIDDLCRRIVEWRIWTVPSRLSYCAYLLHVAFIRNYVAFQTTITHTNLVLMNQVFIGFILAAFIAAIPLYLMVEAPVGNLIKEYITNPRKATDKGDEEKQNGAKEDFAKKVPSISETIAMENGLGIHYNDGQTRL